MVDRHNSNVSYVSFYAKSESIAYFSDETETLLWYTITNVAACIVTAIEDVVGIEIYCYAKGGFPFKACASCNVKLLRIGRIGI